MPAKQSVALGKHFRPSSEPATPLSTVHPQGSWAVYPDRTPWGALSDHLVLTNETNLLLSGTNAVIILGGMDDRSIYSRQMWSYNGVYETYARMPDMPVPRTRFAGAIGNGKIFVVRHPTATLRRPPPATRPCACAGLRRYCGRCRALLPQPPSALLSECLPQTPCPSFPSPSPADTPDRPR